MELILFTGGGWRVAFGVERIEGGNVVGYLPGVSDHWSGVVCIMPEEGTKPLDLPLTSVIEHFEGFGKGSNELLRDRL